MKTTKFGTLADQISVAVAHANFGTASARKRGRNPLFPYVPLIVDTQGREHQILGRAFEARQEAIAFAQQHIRNLENDLRHKLAEPRSRALREWYGLSREIEDVL